MYLSRPGFPKLNACMYVLSADYQFYFHVIIILILHSDGAMQHKCCSGWYLLNIGCKNNTIQLGPVTVA